MQIRIYSISEDGKLEEWCNGSKGQWVPGYLTKLNVQTAPNSSVAAVNWDGQNIRVYCQGKNATENSLNCNSRQLHSNVCIKESSNAIQEYCVGNPWKKGATLPVADIGSNLAAVSWTQKGKPHLRVYYQTADLSVQEHCYDNGWSKGKLKQCLAFMLAY